MMRTTALKRLLPLFAILLLAGCGGDLGGERAEEAQTPEEILAALRTERGQMDAATDQMLQRIRQWNAAHGAGQRIDFSQVFTPDMEEGERAILDQLVAEEKDPTYRGLLKQIREDRDKIQLMEQRIRELESRLPGFFVTAQKGDTHYKLCYDFLSKDQALPEEKVREFLADIGLFEDLKAGHRVWLYYDKVEDRFATWVTQGEAKQSPFAVQRAYRRRMIEDRDQAVARASTLAEERDQLTRRVDGLKGDVGRLEGESTQLKAEISGLKEEKAAVEGDLDKARRELTRIENSVFYHAASEKKLKEQGIVKDTIFTFPQLENPDRVPYDQTLDLREGLSIALNPGDFGMSSIAKVVVFPKYYEEGKDFRVHHEGGGVSVEIVNTAAFRARRILIALK